LGVLNHGNGLRRLRSRARRSLTQKQLLSVDTWMISRFSHRRIQKILISFNFLELLTFIKVLIGSFMTYSLIHNFI
jgi:hypothetical protein